MRKAAKRDANEPEIVAALEAIGARVYRLSQEGIPDLLVGAHGRWVLLEVKGPRGKLEPAQSRFFADTLGYPRHVVRTAEEAIEACTGKTGRG